MHQVVTSVPNQTSHQKRTPPITLKHHAGDHSGAAASVAGSALFKSLGPKQCNSAVKRHALHHAYTAPNATRCACSVLKTIPSDSDVQLAGDVADVAATAAYSAHLKPEPDTYNCSCAACSSCRSIAATAALKDGVRSAPASKILCDAHQSNFRRSSM